MEASPDSVGRRRKRYTRAPEASPTALTPIKWRALGLLAQCRVLSLPQMALLLEGESIRPKIAREKSARRHLRDLFDAGLVSIAPVSRAALATDATPNDATLLYGSAPNIYTPTRDGMKALAEMGLIPQSAVRRSAPSYGPKNALFLAHELMVRDVRVWIERLTYTHPGSELLRWEDGPDATLPLPSELEARPDAWFAFRIGDAEKAPVLVGLVEVDRGTERGRARWREKVELYQELFASDALVQSTGYRNARILVAVPTMARRERLAETIAEECQALDCPELGERFWLATVKELLGADSETESDIATLHTALWRIPGRATLSPMLQ